MKLKVFNISFTIPLNNHPALQAPLQRKGMACVIPSDVKSEGGQRPGCLFVTLTTLILFLFANPSLAQFKVSGSVKATSEKLAINSFTATLGNFKASNITNQNGEFVFENVPNGEYTLTITALGFTTYTSYIKVNNADVKTSIILNDQSTQLKEVEIKDKKTDFGFTHLKAVENLGIYEGKKSEVIIPDQLVANLSTNNARQIYSKVAGLNIWESDGAGIQLSIGGRGLDPNRTSNFNTRQNGYDISADALGYPESYYTPPAEAVEQIQLVRGAASLQYGTQFGGLLNFIMKKPVKDKPFELIVRQSVGSYGFYNTFTSASGTVGKLSYYTYFQYKKGDGFRGNSDFNFYNGFANINYQVNEKTKIGFDYTHMNYLAHQPGGLSDNQFNEDPTQSNRERNWFKVNWNLFALNVDHDFDLNNKFNLRVFGVHANRYTVGFRPNRVEAPDNGEPRDLIKGDFDNWGAEARYIKKYRLFNSQSTLLLGGRYYEGFNNSLQGRGTTGKNADFNFVEPETYMTSEFTYPNKNIALFAENIFRISDQFSVVPGMRYEYINTKANGYYGFINYDLAGNIINHNKTPENVVKKRNFPLFGLGMSYKPTPIFNIYANLSQNYRSVTFSDIRTANPSAAIDPFITDEKGYSIDLGIRSEQTSFYGYDISAFYLNYNNRIGEYITRNNLDQVIRLRDNVGQAVIFGVESYGEADVIKLLSTDKNNWSGVIFGNVAFIKSEYKKSDIPGLKGNEVEFVPAMNLKSGIRLGYKDFKASFQYTHLSDQYADATNAVDGGLSAVVGVIPAYTIMDASLSYQYKRYKLEGSINNLANTYYFTRRATGYPGPGIIPSDNRIFFLTFQIKI
jgi:Fe(3+) dicitrate transport protein